MQKDDHVHFANIVSGLEERWVDQHLYTVAQQAKATCALLLSDWHRMEQPA
jgi:hypothetical protein